MRLPNYEDLTEDQKVVIDLPLDESHLITGAPGSGKSVMACYRSQMIANSGQPTMFLMYNKTLRMYTKDALNQLGVDESVIEGWMGWFPRWFRSAFGQPPLTQGGRYNFHWPSCIETAASNPPPENLKSHVIFDEGQDMPNEFWMFIGNATKSVSVFADENQIINDANSTVEEILVTSGIRHRAHLETNFRNTPAINKVAGHFYVGDGSPPARISGDTTDGDKPKLFSHRNRTETVDYLTKYENTNATRTIVLILLKKREVEYFYRKLSESDTRNEVQMYLSSTQLDFSEINFVEPGIKIVTSASCKGLEFDTVVIPELQSFDRVIMDSEAEMFSRKMYVMCSRARSELIMIYSGNGTPEVVRHLPLGDMDDRR